MPANRLRDHVLAQPERRAAVAGRFQAVDHVLQKPARLRPAQERRQAFQLEGVPAKFLHPESHLLQSREIALDPFRVARRELDHLRQEKPLRRHALLFHPAAQFFEKNALVRGVLVDQDEALRVFHQDVKLVQDAEDAELMFRQRRAFLVRRKAFVRHRGLARRDRKGGLRVVGRRHGQLWPNERDLRHDRRAKLLLPAAPVALQRAPNRSHDGFPHSARIAETHFALGRVHIHVHLRRIEFEEEKRDRELPFHERGVVALLQRRADDRALDRAPVHEDKLLRPARPAYSRLTDETAHPQLSLSQVPPRAGAPPVHFPSDREFDRAAFSSRAVGRRRARRALTRTRYPDARWPGG